MNLLAGIRKPRPKARLFHPVGGVEGSDEPGGGTGQAFLLRRKMLGSSG